MFEIIIGIVVILLVLKLLKKSQGSLIVSEEINNLIKLVETGEYDKYLLREKNLFDVEASALSELDSLVQLLIYRGSVLDHKATLSDKQKKKFINKYIERWEFLQRNANTFLDGKSMLFSTFKNTLTILDTESYQTINTLNGHTSTITSTVMMDDGKTLFSADYNGIIKQWNLQSAKEISSFKGNKGQINSLSISFNGKYLISGGFDTFVKIWDIESLELSYEHNIYASTDSVLSVDNDKYLAVKRSDCINIIDFKTGKQIRSFGEWSEDEVGFARTADQNHLLSARYDHVIELLNVADGTLVLSFKGHTDCINSIAVSPNGKNFVSGSSDGTIRIWDIQKGVNLNIIKVNYSISSLVITPDEQHILSSDDDGNASIWDINTAKEIQKINIT